MEGGELKKNDVEENLRWDHGGLWEGKECGAEENEMEGNDRFVQYIQSNQKREGVREAALW